MGFQNSGEYRDDQLSGERRKVWQDGPYRAGCWGVQLVIVVVCRWQFQKVFQGGFKEPDQEKTQGAGVQRLVNSYQ